MSNTTFQWSPVTNPVHFLIELHDTLRGGLDRLFSLSASVSRSRGKSGETSAETAYEEERKRYESLRGEVTQQFIDRTAVRESIVGTATGLLARALPPLELPAVRALVGDFTRVIHNFCHLQPVTHFEIPPRKPPTQSLDERTFLVERCNEVQKQMVAGLGFRSVLFRLMGEAGVSFDPAVAERDFRLDAAVQFRTLSDRLPTYNPSGSPPRPPTPAGSKAKPGGRTPDSMTPRILAVVNEEREKGTPWEDIPAILKKQTGLQRSVGALRAAKSRAKK